MTRTGCAALAALLAGVALAQAPAGTTEVTADGCKLYLPSSEAKGASRIRWSGQCKEGLADGRGVVRIYSGGKISRVSESTFAAGKVTSAGESYFIRGGEAIRSRGGDNLQIAASELPTWALELSMLVEDRPVRAAPKPAPRSEPTPRSAEKAAPEQKAMEEKAKAEAQKAEAQRQADAKAAAEKLAAEKAAQDAERKRLQTERAALEAERKRLQAEKQAAEKERIAAEAKVAAEKRAAEKAAQEAEAKRQQAEKDRALAEAKAAAEKRAAEKAAQEADAKRQQADRERAMAEAKAAAERAAAAEKLAAEKAAAETRAAAEAKAAADAKVAAEAKAAAEKRAQEQIALAAAAKAAAEKPRTPYVPGRGFADAGSGEPLRAVVTFKLTTDEGRELGVATFVAGKGEAAIRQNANALASAYEKVSPFKAKLLEQPEVGSICSGPGYVVEARVTYPSAKSYGWYAGCMGDDIEKAAKSMQGAEEQLHRDFKVSATSFWAYQYLIVGYVDEGSIRGRAEYERVARPGLMAPGRVMVLTKPEQWAECNDIVNKDPKLKDKVGCLREAVGKLKTSLGLR